MILPNVPTSIPDNIRRYLLHLNDAIVKGASKFVSREQAVGSVILVSPGGSVYTVGVDDDGELVITKVSGPPTP